REYLKADDYTVSTFSAGLRYTPTNGPERKAGDMMTDAKIPLFLRKEIPILFSKDSASWIAGWRIAKSAAVSSGDDILEATLELPGATPWNGNKGGDAC
ncbi:tRNA lysidine(34) synthetase TilS, partial [bacterium]|nr:tRNA lysidine(34) synthetase TilS [bacterium]